MKNRIESKRLVAVIFGTIARRMVIKYLLLIAAIKAFFKVVASAMAISH